MILVRGGTMQRMRFLRGFFVLLLFVGMTRAAEEPIYDEKADASRQIAAAITVASQPGKPVRNIVLVFGANWCPDCHALDDNMHKPELAALIEKHFAVVKIDVGQMDKNLDVALKHGVPVKRGIPAMAVLDSRGKLLYAQDQGQFADARHMSFESIKAFFEQWKPRR
jgi:thioredoxin 1